jgi:hypothetical protein
MSKTLSIKERLLAALDQAGQPFDTADEARLAALRIEVLRDLYRVEQDAKLLEFDPI